MSLLAPAANDQYRGARASAWFLALAGFLTLVPGMIHAFLPDGGAGSIAGLDMGDRRELVPAESHARVEGSRRRTGQAVRRQDGRRRTRV